MASFLLSLYLKAWVFTSHISHHNIYVRVLTTIGIRSMIRFQLEHKNFQNVKTRRVTVHKEQQKECVIELRIGMPSLRNVLSLVTNVHVVTTMKIVLLGPKEQAVQTIQDGS